MKNKNRGSLAAECVKAYRDTGDDTDVLGSYTGLYRGGAPAAPGQAAIAVYPPCGESLSGKPKDDAVPVQDADDL